MHMINRWSLAVGLALAVAGCSSGEGTLREAAQALNAAAGEEAQRAPNMLAVQLAPGAFEAITQSLNAAKPEQRTLRFRQTGSAGNLWEGNIDCLPGGFWRQTRLGSVFFTHQDATTLEAALGPLAFTFEPDKLLIRTTIAALAHSHLKANLDCRPFPLRPSIEVAGALTETAITLVMTLSVTDGNEIRYAAALVDAPSLQITVSGKFGILGEKRVNLPVSGIVDRGVEGRFNAAIAKDGVLQLPGAAAPKRYSVEMQELKPAISPSGIAVTVRPTIRWAP